MLIIFDLDDTLIDTFALQPKVWEVVLDLLISKGLTLDDKEAAYKRLLAINEASPNGATALKTFLEEVGQSNEALFEAGKTAYYNFEDTDSVLRPLSKTIDTLSYLKVQGHTLLLVTYGKKNVQNHKINSLHLRHFFDKIIITEEYDKGAHYAAILKEYTQRPVIVVGDKYETDLKPAKELGLHTVHIQHGRGKHDAKGKEHAQYSITKIDKLIAIVEALEQ